MVSEKRLGKINAVVSQRQQGLAVVLEDIHDPHNAEAIFRSCDAFGVQNVYLIFDKEKAWNPQKIGKQSSSSAHKWLTFHIFRNVEECIDELKKKNYLCAGTSLDVTCKSIFSNVFGCDRIALFVGNEHSGLSRRALALMDVNVMIPMRGMVESLNVSVATAVFLYEITRTRGKNNSFSDEEQQKLVEDFVLRSSKRMRK
jgi:tRNA (guanosine-2'-O-)-methyltransferase